MKVFVSAQIQSGSSCILYPCIYASKPVGGDVLDAVATHVAFTRNCQTRARHVRHVGEGLPSIPRGLAEGPVCAGRKATCFPLHFTVGGLHKDDVSFQCDVTVASPTRHGTWLRLILRRRDTPIFFFAQDVMPRRRIPLPLPVRGPWRRQPDANRCRIRHSQFGGRWHDACVASDELIRGRPN